MLPCRTTLRRQYTEPYCATHRSGFSSRKKVVTHATLFNLALIFCVTTCESSNHVHPARVFLGWLSYRSLCVPLLTTARLCVRLLQFYYLSRRRGSGNERLSVRNLLRIAPKYYRHMGHRSPGPIHSRRFNLFATSQRPAANNKGQDLLLSSRAHESIRKAQTHLGL